MRSFFNISYKTFKIVSIVYLFCLSTTTYAQPADPQGGVDPDPVPIHGIAYLLLGGLIIGIKKIIDIRKRKI